MTFGCKVIAWIVVSPSSGKFFYRGLFSQQEETLDIKKILSLIGILKLNHMFKNKGLNNQFLEIYNF